MKFPRNAKIFRGQLDATPFAGVFFCLVLFILLMGIVFKHDAFESLLFAVALGVGLTPEFLPVISAITLTQGALRMARDHVIVKHLPAIQDLGSIDILCSDKTGTLTAGVMQFDRALDPTGRASPRPLTLACINARFETGIRRFSAKRPRVRASISGVSRYLPLSSGRPALGTQATRVRASWARVRMWSVMNSGPVAQLSPR